MSEANARLESLREVVRRFERVEVLVVGDVMLDEYLHGEVERVSPEAPVPVVAVARESRALGGAGNVVRNLAALGARVRLCSVVGDDVEGRLVVDLLKELGVDTSGIVVDETRCTTRKTRIVARDQQMIRADREQTTGLADDVQAQLEARVRALVRGVDGLALVDYGKGVLEPEGARRLIAIAGEAGVPVAVDPKRHLDAYAGARLVKPNLVEARQLLGAGAPEEDLGEALASGLGARLPGAEIALTLGGEGMVVREAADRAKPRTVPTAALDVYDVQGAGDTSLAALFLARLAGAGLADAALLANAASGVAVGKVGTATASREELLAWLPRVLEAAHRRDIGGMG